MTSAAPITVSPRKPLDAAASAVMLALCAIWGAQQVIVKLVQADMSPLLQMSVRSGLATLILLAIVFARGEQGGLIGGRWKPGLVVGLMFGLEFVFIGEGLRFTSASHMAIFLYTAPIFAALGLHLRMAEERLSPLQWTGILLAFGGVAASFSGRSGGGAGDLAWFGDLLGVAAGAVWGATTVVVRGSRLADAPAAVTLTWQLAGGFALPTIAVLALGQTTVTPTAGLAASLAFQTLVVSVTSYLVWFTLLRTYLASRLGVLSFMTPVFGIAFGVLVLRERLDAAFLLGAALIVAGILLVSGGDLRDHLPTKSAPARRRK